MYDQEIMTYSPGHGLLVRYSVTQEKYSIRISFAFAKIFRKGFIEKIPQTALCSISVSTATEKV
jgi:hypothetical protein